MPIEKTITLYRYNELADDAKKRARDWYLSGLYWPDVLEPALDQWRILAKNLGFTIARGPWWDLYLRTFFIGRGTFLRPDDSELDALAREWGGLGGAAKDVLSLIAAVRAIRPDMSAVIEDGEVIDVDGGRFHVEEPDADFQGEEWDEYDKQVEAIDKEERGNIADALSELEALGLDWLKKEADCIESEESVAEVMEANGWLFHADGSFARY